MPTNKTTTKNPAPKMTMRTVHEFPEAAPGLAFFVIGPFCWGRAKSATAALAKARMEGGPGTYTLHLVNDDAEVDGVCGTLRYRSTTPGIMTHIAQVNLR